MSLHSEGELKMFDFNKIEEPIKIEPHKNYWKDWYVDETILLRNIFEPNLISFEHIGSTAVPDLDAKPIVDIAIGLRDFLITDLQIQQLKELGYEYFGQLHITQERFFARKRKNRNFNLAIIPYNKKEWIEYIALRNYLRTHPDKVQQYSKIKNEAITLGKTSLLAYHSHKETFVINLISDALEWNNQCQSAGNR